MKHIIVAFLSKIRNSPKIKLIYIFFLINPLILVTESHKSNFDFYIRSLIVFAIFSSLFHITAAVENDLFIITFLMCFRDVRISHFPITNFSSISYAGRFYVPLTYAYAIIWKHFFSTIFWFWFNRTKIIWHKI